MSFNFTEVLILLVIFQLLFISFFLFSHQKGKRVSNRLLGVFFLSLCLNLVDSIFLLKRVYHAYPSWALWGSSMPLLYGPLMFLYVQSVVYKDFKLNSRRWMHFIPFIFLTIFSLISYNSQDTARKMEILDKIILRQMPPYIYIVSLFIYLHFFSYMFLSLKTVNLHQEVAANKFSDRRRTELSWLRSTLVFLTGLMLLGAAGSFIGLTSFSNFYYLALTILIAVFILFINRVLLRALRNPEVFEALEEEESKSGEPKPVDLSPAVEENAGASKYAGSTLQETDKKKILDALLHHMNSKRPYLEPELSLEQLARQLSVKPRALSQVINEMTGQSFFDFINTYRIEEAKRLLSDKSDPKITVLEILYEVGFNSKSSFNTIFKRQTGLTPSEFKKKMQGFDSGDLKVEPKK